VCDYSFSKIILVEKTITILAKPYSSMKEKQREEKPHIELVPSLLLPKRSSTKFGWELNHAFSK